MLSSSLALLLFCFFCIAISGSNSMTVKKIFITGSTDGLGFETAKRFVQEGHTVLIHGRSKNKIKDATRRLYKVQQHDNQIESYCADLSKLDQVKSMADKVKQKHPQIDVLINNAGIFKTPVTKADNGIDIRFMVNAVAPYFLTKQLLPILKSSSGDAGAARVVNMSSAAQAPVSLQALSKDSWSMQLSDFDAYAQSKLAIVMWTNYLMATLPKPHPMMVSLNPASLLATKMVKEGFNNPGKDINIGVNIMAEAALGDRFADASGKYFDNDRGSFSQPSSDALNPSKCAKLVQALDQLIADDESCSAE